jgi:hypothetical protein
MNPLRWEVLGFAFVLALPVLAMGLRGDLTLDDVIARLPWCLAAAWAAMSLLAAVARPRPQARRRPGAGADRRSSADTDPASTP